MLFGMAGAILIAAIVMWGAGVPHEGIVLMLGAPLAVVLVLIALTDLKVVNKVE